MDIEFLSRFQFAFTIGFHYIFPPMTIGLGLLLVIMEARYLYTKNIVYEKMTQFWIKIFALIFGIGVASGIVMEFEFGTNWSNYSRFVGDVFGSALAAEGIFAFALESGFLGVLLFGWNRVSPKVHFFSTIMVFIGSVFSAVWIVVANSWQQTPTGYHIVNHNGMYRAEITDFWEMVFNPSSMTRLGHVLLGAILAGALLVISVHAFYIIRKKHIDISRKAMKIGIIVALVASLLQLYAGHSSGEVVAKYQPAKLAALEGHYNDNEPATLYAFGYVDQEEKKVYGLGIPGGLSFLIYNDFNAPIKGLEGFDKGEKPNHVNLIFQTYHIMVAIGLLLILLSIVGTILLKKGRLYKVKWLLWIFVIAVILPHISNQFGWYSAEIGRQPWVVYGLLKTSEAFSPSVSGAQILFSLILFIVIYIFLFILFIFLLTRKIMKGPEDNDHNTDMNQSAKREIPLKK
ncbi:MAG: cytochrome ubiquinol oxidase subunit I [Hyphomicrobiales bacterium]